MGAFFIYVLKSSVCLVLFYLFFRLLLSKETFHRFNRVALLGVLFLSLLIPCMEMTTRLEVQQAVLSFEQLLMMAELQAAAPVVDVSVQEASSVSWIQMVLLAYLAGIVLLVSHNVYSLFRLFRLIHSGRRERLEKGITLVVHQRDVAPFSWMKYVVISQKDLEENGREILIHEMAHVRHRHSIDLLLADVCIFFQWFNPGAWLLKQELQNIHEYEADESVINKGVNAKEYQLLLIKKAVGTRLYSMANSFNHSKLKKRITMMLKEKSSPWARLKYAYVLPLAAIAVTAFARPEISETVEEISAVKVNDLAEIVQEKVWQDTVKASKKDGVVVTSVKTKENDDVFAIVEQMPQYPGGMNALLKYLKRKVEDSPMKNKASGRVLVGFTVTETGKIKDVHVLESDEAVLNGEAERIVGEMPDWIPGQQMGKPVPVKFSVAISFGGNDVVVRRTAMDKHPLIIVDGKEISLEEMEKLDQSTIESITVLKDSSAVKTYGERGSNGVMLIDIKKGSSGKETAQVDAAVPDFAVSGTVVDEQGHPKAGVSVIVPNTSHGAVTDANGRFSLKAIKGGDLYFSFIGYKSVKAPVTSTMNVQMEQEVFKLFPEPSGSVKDVKVTSLKTVNRGNIILNGLNAEQPLVIIDGKESAEKDVLSKLAQDRIKSISILKDKSSTELYGDKGKNGVMIIEMLTEEEYQASQSKK